MNEVKELFVIEEKRGINTVNARELHERLEVGRDFTTWIKDKIETYGFIKGEDYIDLLTKSGEQVSGRKTIREYHISIDMAKELSMVENNDIGKACRKYFIKAEKEFKKIQAARLAGIQARRTLTDEIRDSGENERMHGHGYSTYTNLAYKLTGIEKGSRESLAPDDLKRLDGAESMMKLLIEMGKNYNDIKDTLRPIFKEADNE